MGGFFSMFAQSATGRKLQFCDKRDIWPSAQPGRWNFFSDRKDIKSKLAVYPGLNRENI